MQPSLIALPPWSLTGDGFIWLFKFPRDFIERNGFLTDWQRVRLTSTLGAVMLVDYGQTNVGPYRELLFIPGQFELSGKRLFSISKIYVSTRDSVWNGIENWGIPKELVDFTRQPHADGSETFNASLDSHTIFSATLVPFGPSFPISSSLVPLTVAQELRGDLLITQPTATGSARLCRVRDLRVNKACFPNVAEAKPIAVVAVKDFRMTFPIPQIERGYFNTAQSIATTRKE